MPESPKAETKVDLVFEYSRARDGVYSGTATVIERGVSARPPLHVVVHQKEWVSFVVNTIRSQQELGDVSFELKKPDRSSYRYTLDQRTVERIKDATYTVEDLIL